MRAVEADEEWAFLSPKDKAVVRRVSARSLWIRILTARVETGEPYLLFIDHVNDAIPEHHKLAGLKVKMSNLCSEITLPTGMDADGNERTAVCCLSSVNLENYPRMGKPSDLHRRLHPLPRQRAQRLHRKGAQLDGARQILGAARTLDRAWRHGLPLLPAGDGRAAGKRDEQGLEPPHVPAPESGRGPMASVKLAHERGACLDAAEYGIMERFSNKIAIAPTASISIICGGTSAGIEPIPTNAYTHKTLSGSFLVRNPQLEDACWPRRASNDEDTWNAIVQNEGSVQQLDFLSDDEKMVFKTAFELDQRWLIDLAADRTPFICQSQSLNLFIPADIHKRDLHQIHFQAWKKGVKSLYYCRSKSIQRAESSLGVTDTINATTGSLAVELEPRLPLAAQAAATSTSTDYEECLACQ